jgi:hypothetical protein
LFVRAVHFPNGCFHPYKYGQFDPLSSTFPTFPQLFLTFKAV